MFGVVLFVQVGILWQNPGIGLPLIGDVCFVSGNPPTPYSIRDLTNTSVIIHNEILKPNTDERQITLKFNLTWTAPIVPYGNFLYHNIWLGSEILNDPNDGRQLDRFEVGVWNGELCIKT